MRLVRKSDAGLAVPVNRNMPSDSPMISADHGNSPSGVRQSASKVTRKPASVCCTVRLDSCGLAVFQLRSRTRKAMPRSVSVPL